MIAQSSDINSPAPSESSWSRRHSKSRWRTAGTIAGLVAGVVGTLPFIAKAIEEPKYSVLETFDGWEIRQYEPSIEARVTVEGPWSDAGSKGFRVLAKYIFGGNQPSASIDMTAPVATQRTNAGQDIAMTAPVATQRSDDRVDQWTVAFTMPSEWTMETLPEPNDPRVNLVTVAPRTVAVISFGMWATEDRVAEKTSKLRAELSSHGLMPIGEPVVAQYSPPWTPPPFRTNEIQWLVESGD